MHGSCADMTGMIGHESMSMWVRLYDIADCVLILRCHELDQLLISSHHDCVVLLPTTPLSQGWLFMETNLDCMHASSANLVLCKLTTPSAVKRPAAHVYDLILLETAVSLRLVLLNPNSLSGCGKPMALLSQTE